MASKGWTWTWQRCGRYKYQKLLVHTTNPDHLAASTPSLTDIPPLQVVPPIFDVRGRRGLMNNRNLTSCTCRSLGAPDE